MTSFYITFWPDHKPFDWVSSKGFVEIRANSMSVAREIAFANFGREWCNIYPERPQHP